MKTPSLAEIIRSFPERRIAVLGDLMLDVYLWGRVSRISPEAPVPVVNVVNRTCCLGGAGNVMRNVSTLGARAFAFGVVGRDQTGDELSGELGRYRIGTEGVLRDDSRRTKSGGSSPARSSCCARIMRMFMPRRTKSAGAWSTGLPG